MDFKQEHWPVIGTSPRPITPIDVLQAREIRDRKLAEIKKEEELNSDAIARMRTAEYKMGMEYSKQYINEQFYGQIRRAAEQGLNSYHSYIGGPATGQSCIQSRCYLEGLMDGCINALRSKGFETKAEVSKSNSYSTTRLDITVSW